MKKFLALALILTLALSVSVFAADHAYGPEGGTTTAPNGSVGTNLSITATANEVENRYAIDVEYSNMQVSVTAAGMYWDVETFEYKMKDTGTSTPTDTTATITIKNRSDLTIQYSFIVTDLMLENDDNDGITFTTDKTQDTKYPITRAIAKAGDEDGHTTDDSFTVTSTSTDWKAVANFYASYFSAHPSTDPLVPATKEIATVSISFFPG